VSHSEQTSDPPETKLVAFLSAKSVKKVLFIDDGFDGFAHAELTSEEQDQLWAAIVADDAARESALAEEITGPDALSGDLIANLLDRPESHPLRQLAQTVPYVVEQLGKIQEVMPAIEYLRSLGLHVPTAGESSWREHLDDTSIVFLDWRLGQEGDHRAAVARAEAVAAEIHRDRGPATPIIVLISSDPSIKDYARSFSLKSGLISGLFHAVPKSGLQDPADIGFLMTVLCRYLQEGHVVQNFVDAVRRNTDAAAAAFVEQLRNLTLSDYANLQRFALRNDGHPLGDYLVELLAGVWVDLLFRGELRRPLKELNKQDFEGLPALTEPSDAMNGLYNAAMFDMHIGDFEAHPHSPDGAEELRRLAIGLGDVILEEQSGCLPRLYVVVNPQCDLAESPRQNRFIDADLSVLLVPGSLRPVGTPERSARKQAPDTPYFMIDDHKYRVQWDIKKQIAIPYGEFSRWVDCGNCGNRTRKARMRPTYVLALQGAVRSELARVGLPVPPPVYDKVKAKERLARAGKWISEPTDFSLGQLLMAGESASDRVVLDGEYSATLIRKVRDGVIELQKTGNAKDMKAAARISEALRDPLELLRLAEPFQFPHKEPTELLGKSVIVCRESKTPRESFSRSYIVCLTLPG
jgi:hypothetical protein